MSYVEPCEFVGLQIAQLGMEVDADRTGLRFILPECYRQFISTRLPDGGLVLRLQDGKVPGTYGWEPLLDTQETWGLWRDVQGRLMFTAPRVAPPRRCIVVDAGFSRGEVIGEFSASATAGVIDYPLQNIEIKFFINWLAGSGDIILHAAGVEDAGKGYVFAGFSGSGKSTLARSLATDPSIQVLGEDQVILRYLEGKFWIYGTPWHMDARMCSPRGVPLERMFFLERDGEQRLERLNPVEGVTRVLQTAFIPYYRPEVIQLIMDRLAMLSRQVGFHKLSYKLGTDVLGVIREINTTTS